MYTQYLLIIRYIIHHKKTQIKQEFREYLRYTAYSFYAQFLPQDALMTVIPEIALCICQEYMHTEYALYVIIKQEVMIMQ